MITYSHMVFVALTDAANSYISSGRVLDRETVHNHSILLLLPLLPRLNFFLDEHHSKRPNSPSLVAIYVGAVTSTP